MSKHKLKGIILAGGEGTRFRPLTYYLQKCMIPVGQGQKPVLEYIIRLFKYHEIRELVLLVDYKHQQIRNYFNDGARFDVQIEYALDKPELKGSANALLNAYHQGIISSNDYLIAYYGDIISNINLSKLASQHIESRAAATVVLARGYKVRVGTAEVNEGLITQFIEKPELRLPVSVGLLVLKGDVLSEMDRLSKEECYTSFDLMGDVIPYLIEKGLPVGAFFSDAFWYDLGSIERYEKFENENLSKKLNFLFEDL